MILFMFDEWLPEVRKMELKWLEDFVTLADCSSFSRAAQMRNITQPAFSRRIKQLEGWLGAVLISRASMPAELTPAGQNFLPIAREAIRSFYAAREANRPATEADLLRVAALHTIVVTFFPHWVQKLHAQGIELRSSHIPDRGEIEGNLAALIDGEADILLTYAHDRVPLHLDHMHFDHVTVATDRLIPVVAPQLMVAGRGMIDGRGVLDRAVAEGFALPYLSYGYASFFGLALARLFAEYTPFRREIAHENTVSAAHKALSVMGAGLCWQPESLVRDELATGRLVTASEDKHWALDLDIRLYRHRGEKHPMVERLWQAARDAI